MGAAEIFCPISGFPCLFVIGQVPVEEIPPISCKNFIGSW
jgi:hypothetical protein